MPDTFRELSPNGGSEGTRAALGSRRHRRGGEREAELEEALSGLRIVKEDGEIAELRKTVDSTARGFNDGGGQFIGRCTDALARQTEHKLRLGEGAAPTHPNDLIVPEGWERIDVRIEGDQVVTEDGDESLSADEVAA
ncbi:hypothetical protein ACFXJ6_03050 [Streptomyces sp. NPDC059218]|uniref:hypothetical protein n=1 Tax=unclassified Streptomyces TaxID=2593676 RepID=UPI003688FB8A